MPKNVYIQINYNRQEDEPPNFNALFSERLEIGGESVGYLGQATIYYDPNETWDGDLDGHNDGYDFSLNSVGAIYFNRPSDDGADAPGFEDLSWQPSKYISTYLEDSTIEHINQHQPQLIKDVSDDAYTLGEGWSTGPGFSVSVDTSFLTASGVTSAIVDGFTSAFGSVAQAAADSLGVGAALKQALRAKELYDVIRNYHQYGLDLIKYGLDNFETLDPAIFSQMTDDYFQLGQQRFLSELEKQLGTSGLASQVLKNISIISKAGADGTIEVVLSPTIDLTANFDDGIVVTAGVGVSFIAGGAGDEVFVGGQASIEIAAGGGNDYLHAGAGAGTMRGGLGNDTYVVDDAGDVVAESAAEGVDTVQTALVNYTLGPNVENLTFTSGGAHSGTGNDLANVLTGAPGNDSLEGGSGIDTAVFSGNRSAFKITNAATHYSVSGPEGTDALSNVERLQFSDIGIAFDLGAGEGAGNTARIIGAAFDASAIEQHPDWVGIGLELFDSGMSMQAVCELVVDILGLSNTDFVTAVYMNVVGAAPTVQDRDYFVALLEGSGGTMTQAELLDLAADAGMNAQNVNLVGLQQSGLEFF